jgi:hypothetical protein
LRKISECSVDSRLRIEQAGGLERHAVRAAELFSDAGHEACSLIRGNPQSLREYLAFDKFDQAHGMAIANPVVEDSRDADTALRNHPQNRELALCRLGTGPKKAKHISRAHGFDLKIGVAKTAGERGYSAWRIFGEEDASGTPRVIDRNPGGLDAAAKTPAFFGDDPRDCHVQIYSLSIVGTRAIRDG